MTESNGGAQPADTGRLARPPGTPGTSGQPGAEAWRPAAPQPGAIPLRPLSLGEIFNGAITSMRRSPAASLGVAAALSAVAGIVTAFSTHQIDHARSAGNMSAAAADFSAYGASLIISFVLNTLLCGALASVVGRTIEGMSTSLRESWHLARPRLAALLGTTMLLLTIYCALWIPFGLVLTGAIATQQPALISLAVLAALLTILAELAGWTLLIMAATVVMLERTGPAQALRRSWQLVRASFWRVLGILLLTALIFVIASEIIALHFLIAGLAVAGGAHAHVTVWSMTIAGVGAVVAGTVIRPFLAGVTVLLYCDTRMRREGLDLVLRTGGSGPLPAGDPSLIWAPPVPGSAVPGSAGPGSAGLGQPGRAAW
jgi:hypothetical protein